MDVLHKFPHNVLQILTWSKAHESASLGLLPNHHCNTVDAFQQISNKRKTWIIMWIAVVVTGRCWLLRGAFWHPHLPYIHAPYVQLPWNSLPQLRQVCRAVCGTLPNVHSVADTNNSWVWILRTPVAYPLRAGHLQNAEKIRWIRVPISCHVCLHWYRGTIHLTISFTVSK